MHWGVFANSAAHLYQNYLEEPPTPGTFILKFSNKNISEILINHPYL
jgi:hypothetical protein